MKKPGRKLPTIALLKPTSTKRASYVAVTDADFKAANPKATQTIDIEDFVDVEAIDPMLFDKPYYLVPQKNGEKGYFLLRDALKKWGRWPLPKS